MLEWLSSRIIALIAFTVMLASVSSFFLIQRENVEVEELTQIAETIASFIGDVNSVNANFETSISFEEGAGSKGVLIPSHIRKESYEITMTSTGVLLQWRGFATMSSFIGDIHLWGPANPWPRTREQIGVADKNIASWKIKSGTGIPVIRENVPGFGFHTFCPHPHALQLQQVADSLATTIENFTSAPRITEDGFNASLSINSPSGISGMTIYPGVFFLKEYSVMAVGFISVQHLWDLDVLGWKTTTQLIEEKDSLPDNRMVRLRSQDVIQLKRREVELTDRPYCVGELIEYEHIVLTALHPIES